MNKIYSIHKSGSFKRMSHYTLILCVLLLLSSVFINAQTNYNKYISIPLPEQSKSFLEMIFDMNESTYGTKIAQKNKDESAHEKYYRARSEEDTTRKENRILSIRENPEQTLYSLYVDLIDIDQRVTVQVFNMLGKKVKDAYEGNAKDPFTPYLLDVSSLPNGVYLCMVIGSNFKLREKFVISRR